MNNTSLITGATLLSVEEVKQIPEEIRKFGGWWWLRSPGDDTDRAATVYSDGRVHGYGDHVGIDDSSVRPALHLNLKSSNSISDGAKLKIGEYDFTVVYNGEYALCDTSIGESAFRKDYEAEDANIYEASDVKKIVDEWFKNEIKDIDVEMMTYTKIGVA